MHTYVGGRRADLPREVGSTSEVKVNATAQNAGFLLKELRQELANERWKGPVDITKVLWHTAQPREYKILWKKMSVAVKYFSNLLLAGDDY